jgi:type VI secretion system Hcp family effector
MLPSVGGSAADLTNAGLIDLGGGDCMKTHLARFHRHFPAVAALAFALSIPATAMADLITLRLPGIQGNVTAKGQEGTIEVLSLSQGSTAVAPSGTGRENTSPVFSDLNILKRLDLSSPSLFLALVKSSIFNNAVVTFLHETAGGFVKFFSITVNNVSLTQFQASDSEGTVFVGNEQLSLHYDQIQLKDELTGQSACWNLTQVRTC